MMERKIIPAASILFRFDENCLFQSGSCINHGINLFGGVNSLEYNVSFARYFYICLVHAELEQFLFIGIDSILFADVGECRAPWTKGSV